MNLPYTIYRANNFVDSRHLIQPSQASYFLFLHANHCWLHVHRWTTLANKGSQWHSPHSLCIIIQFDVWFVWDIIRKCYIHPMIHSPSNSMYLFLLIKKCLTSQAPLMISNMFFVSRERDICTRNMSWTPL